MNKHRKVRSLRAFLSKNGFYIALVACVIVAAVASYSAVTNIISNLKDENNLTQTPPSTSPNASEVSDPKPDNPPPVEPDGKGQEDAEVSAADDFVPVYSLPVDSGTITHAFSGDELVKNETLNDWRTHNGVDIETAEGTPVKAIYSGEVLRAGYDPLLGYFVEQKLDTGYVVTYANLGEKLNVKAGDRISQNDVVGAVGSSSILENGEKPHLHIEVKSGNKYIDPLSLMDF
jgi:murein DD-endopeptidase MepM/ murein hydrolase activator NlpD